MISILQLIRLRPYLTNTTWILAARAITLTSALFVTTITARHLGPETFGVLSYAISLTGLFSIATHLGLSGLTVREIVKNPTETNAVIGTVLAMKLSAACFAFFCLVITAASTENVNGLTYFTIFIVGARILINPLQTFHQWFESRVEARYIAIAQSLSATLTAIITFTFVYMNAGLLYFALGVLFHFSFTELLVLLFFMKRSAIPFRTLTTSLTRAKILFKQSWPIFLGSAFAVVYLKADQVMLRWLIGDEEVGLYAVAAALSDAWYIVPIALVTSFFPKLIGQAQSNSTLYNCNLQRILDGLLLISVAVAVLVTLISQILVTTLFGDSYLKSADILTIHIWGAVFIFMRAAFSKWILIEGHFILSLVTQGSGAIMNILLNLAFIPSHGGLGAAYATVIAYAFASYVSLFFFPQSRSFAFLMTRSFLLPLRMALFLWQRATR